MATDSDRKVALALLDEVNENVEKSLGNQIAMPIDVDNYDVERDFFCKDMVKQCDLAEKKSPDDSEVLAKSYILKAQLYGCWQKVQGMRGTRKKAKQYYEKVLEIGTNEARTRYRYALFCRVSGSKQMAIDNFKRVIELAGEDSELGLECSKELAKEQEKKGGCFIATAVYGSYSTPEVMLLREFRDQTLLKNVIGRGFVRAYYLISPSFAKIISSRETVKKYVRVCLIEPFVRHVRGVLK